MMDLEAKFPLPRDSLSSNNEEDELLRRANIPSNNPKNSCFSIQRILVAAIMVLLAVTFGQGVIIIHRGRELSNALPRFSPSRSILYRTEPRLTLGAIY